MPDRLLGLLGLAKKAGRLELGLETVTAAARSGKAALILCACDAGQSACRNARHAARTAGVPFVRLPQDKAQLGALLGRGSPGILAVTDPGLAGSVRRALAEAEAAPAQAEPGHPRETNSGKG